MRILLLRIWDTIHTSYWFLPAVMALATVLLAVGSLWFDHTRPDAIEEWIVYQGGPEGARQLLATLTGSMITVAGMIFSITIVALTLAAGDFGPRLLRRFRTDTGTQFALGTFVAAFLYCLLVLRAIREDDLADTPVPSLSVTLAMGISVLSFAVLIYFIHHISSLIQVDNIVASVKQELDESLGTPYPGKIGREPPDGGRPEEQVPSDFDANGEPVLARNTGYIQTVDGDRVLNLALRNDLIVRVRHRPGQFVVEGNLLALAWPRHRCNAKLLKRLCRCFTLNRTRTPLQDVEFAIYQLVEVAIRALSPGVNDAFTALACVDYLGASMSRIAGMPMPSRYRCDEQGRLRVIAVPETFDGAMGAAFNQIRQSAASNVAVSLRLLETIGQIVPHADAPEKLQTIGRHASMVRRAILAHAEETHDRDEVEQRYAELQRSLEQRRHDLS